MNNAKGSCGWDPVESEWDLVEWELDLLCRRGGIRVHTTCSETDRNSVRLNGVKQKMLPQYPPPSVQLSVFLSVTMWLKEASDTRIKWFPPFNLQLYTFPIKARKPQCSSGNSNEHWLVKQNSLLSSPPQCSTVPQAHCYVKQETSEGRGSERGGTNNWKQAPFVHDKRDCNQHCCVITWPQQGELGWLCVQWGWV